MVTIIAPGTRFSRLRSLAVSYTLPRSHDEEMHASDLAGMMDFSGFASSYLPQVRHPWDHLLPFGPRIIVAVSRNHRGKHRFLAWLLLSFLYVSAHENRNKEPSYETNLCTYWKRYRVICVGWQKWRPLMFESSTSLVARFTARVNEGTKLEMLFAALRIAFL